MNTTPKSIRNEFDHPVKLYIEGIPGDPLWTLRDSMGIVGVVQSATWGDAYSAAEDELFPEAGETWEEIAKECECPAEDLVDDVVFNENYGFRPNGANATDVLRHGLYAKDLNGERMEELTPELAVLLRLSIEWEETEEEDEA